MKAIVQDAYGPVERLELREIERPVAGEGEVLVRVRAASVGPWDWHIMTGLPYLVRAFGYGVRAPKARIRGLDLAGVVEAVGPGVTRFRPGDEVFGIGKGSFAEYASARVDKLAVKPANLTFEQAAAVPLAAITAAQGLRDKGNLQPGQKVLIIGAAGGVGTFAVQIAKAMGAHVTGVCSTSKVELVRSIGADEVVDYTRDDFAGMGREYDLMLDTAGNRPLTHLRRALAPRRTLVIVGGEGGGRLLGGTGRHLRAVLLSPFVKQQFRGLMVNERAEDLTVLTELIEAGKVRPVIERTYPLAETADAMRRWAERKVKGKVVVKVTDEDL